MSEFIKRRENKPQEVEGVVDKKEIFNTAGTAVVDFETEGRFSLPKQMNFYDFKGKDVSDMTLCKENERLETLVTLLNKNKHEKYKDVDLQEATPEELLEILVNIKAKYQGNYFPFYWLCDCQNDVPEKDRVANTDNIELSTLKFASISDADKKLREFYKDMFENPENFSTYLKMKYKTNDIDVSKYKIEDELEKIQIKEPFIVADGKNVYEFEFPRIKHMIIANELVEKKYYNVVKNIQTRKEHSVPLAELQRKKENELEKVEREKSKDFIAYVKALSLLTKNGEPLSNEQKVKELEEMSSSVFVDLTYSLDQIKFGLDDERELSCPLCGKKSKRVLRREIDIQYFLPTNIATTRESRKSTKLNIFIGA